MNEIMVEEANEIVCQPFGEDLFSRFFAFVDASPKTIETYKRALRQMFRYFALNGISQPAREDMISFREELKSSGHKPTTIQTYLSASRVFFA